MNNKNKKLVPADDKNAVSSYFSILSFLYLCLVSSLVDANTVTTLQLTSSDLSVNGYAYSGNGRRVVYVSRANLTGQNPEGNSQVYLVDANGAGLRQLTDLASADSAGDIFISEDGNIVVAKITTLVGAADFQESILAINVQSGENRWLVPGSSRVLNLHALSPNGEFTVYSYYQTPGTAGKVVRSVSTTGSYDNEITTYDASSLLFFSADTSTFIYNTNGVIYAVDVTGNRGWINNTNRVMEWTATSGAYAQATGISENGDKIAFYTNYDFTIGAVANFDDIYMVNTDGSGFARITHHNSNGDSNFPYFLQGSNKLLFPSDANINGENPNANSNLYIYDIVNKSISQVTNFSEGYIAFNHTASKYQNRIVYAKSVTVYDYNTYLNSFDGANEVIVNVESESSSGIMSLNGKGFVFRSEKDILGANADGSVELFIRCENEDNIDNACTALLTSGENSDETGGGGAFSLAFLLLVQLIFYGRITSKLRPASYL